MSALVRSSSHTKGAVMRDRICIGTATMTAIGSGLRSANCLGTSSPITSEKKVTSVMTIAKPIVPESFGSKPIAAMR